MKSFKLISLQIVTERNELFNVELTDGLIINKEDDLNTWILEAFLSKTYFDKIQHVLPLLNGEVNVQAVITKKENGPAAFDTVLRSIKEVEGHVSIVFEGHLQRTRSKYAELLLENLIDKGISGEELLEQFKEKIISQPPFITTKKS
ncbi:MULTISPECIES: YwpF family protein [Bacillaceae]|uniref:YwpF-like protein n=1 Tax=Peribacillus huizhouensis TaxID=1501239 RepID=A0ABR6CS51_9BACI|nr:MULTISPECIES: YwpF family protein [Bacillaceae]MBA9027850.1 hypothetical protein [Peribacillus huizhouensis]